MPLPFISPYISSSLEGAFATIQTGPTEPNIKAAGLTPSFAGQVRLGRIGIEAGVDASEIIGADGYSALVLGANYSYGASGTLRVPILKNPHWIITPVLGLQSQKGGSFSPLNAVAKSMTTEAEASNFVAQISTFKVRAGLLSAFAFNPTFGISAELSRIFSQTTSDTRKVDDGFLRGGAALSANLHPELGIPIGLLGAYRNDWPLETGAESSPIYEFGLFEMLRQDFNFGIEISRLVTSTPTLSVLLSLTYYY